MSESASDGEAHWQFSRFGDFRYSVQKGRPRIAGERKSHRAWQDGILVPEEYGVWRHLATTYDADQRLVIHFLDGEEVSRHVLAEKIPLFFGLATIGNTSYGSNQYWGSRQFGGAIDEFALYSKVLSPKSIAALYEEGRPD